MSTSRVEDQGDRLVVVNGNSARRGALTPEFYDVIQSAVDQARDVRIRAIVLTSDGPFFCAGGDLNVLIERRELAEGERRTRVDMLHDVVRAIRGSPVPVIAAVEGGAAGAGLSLALACDLIVAAEGARFTAAYVKAGLVPDGGLTSALARMLPRPLAMEMCLLARPVEAARMAALGVVTELVEPGETLTVAQELVDALALGPRAAQGIIRALVGQAYEKSEAAQLDCERDAMARAVAGDEAGEGISAFLEKRKPRF